jgi:hypothetical protein
MIDGGAPGRYFTVSFQAGIINQHLSYMPVYELITRMSRIRVGFAHNLSRIGLPYHYPKKFLLVYLSISIPVSFINHFLSKEQLV